MSYSVTPYGSFCLKQLAVFYFKSYGQFLSFLVPSYLHQAGFHRLLVISPCHMSIFSLSPSFLLDQNNFLSMLLPSNLTFSVTFSNLQAASYLSPLLPVMTSTWMTVSDWTGGDLFFVFLF